MSKFIPYGRQNIIDSDINTVVNVLKSDWITRGPAVQEFEQSCASLTKAKYGVAMNSATSALHAACLALGLGKDDILWTSPNSFVASANCAIYCGAKVDFVDIDPRTYNMSLEALEAKLQVAAKKNQLPKIIIPVHFAGQSCQMKEIKALTEPYNIKIIEDAAHAIGGKYFDEPVGGCKYSDITIFSFHPVKIITTAEGGMALTNTLELKEKMELYRNNGVTRDPGKMQRTSEGPWYYEQLQIGYNYHMTDLQAGLGLSQLQRLDAFISRRKELARRYDAQLSEEPVICPWQLEDASSSYHLYPIKLKSTDTIPTRLSLFETLREAGIGVNVHYIPIHTQPFYQQFGFKREDCPNTVEYYQNAISLPLYFGLSDEEQDYILGVLKKALRG